MRSKIRYKILKIEVGRNSYTLKKEGRVHLKNALMRYYPIQCLTDIMYRKIYYA